MSEQSDLTKFESTGESDSRSTSATEVAEEPTGDDEVQESEFWEVPDDWEIVEPGEVYEVNPSYDPDEEKVTYIEMDALDTELPYPRYYGKRVADDYSGRQFTAGDVLAARITPCTENGKAAFVPEMDTRVGIGSTEYAVLSAKTERIHPWYLYYVTKSHPIHSYAVSRMRGTTGRQRVPFDVYRREIDIPLPPIEEQRKIAGVLNTFDQTLATIQEDLDLLEREKQGIVQELFTHGVDHHEEYTEHKTGDYPAEWEIVPFENLLTDTRYGTDNKSNTDGKGYPTLRIPNVVKKRITTDDLKHTPLEDKELDRLRLEDGDILVVRTNGNPDYVGRAASFDERDEDFVYASYLIRLRVDEERVHPGFVREFLNSPRGRAEMQGWIRSSAGNYNLSVGAMEKFDVPVPSLEEQKEIVDRIETVEELMQKTRQRKDLMKDKKCKLLNDLVSGTVRVSDVEIEIPEEVAKYG